MKPSDRIASEHTHWGPTFYEDENGIFSLLKAQKYELFSKIFDGIFTTLRVGENMKDSVMEWKAATIFIRPVTPIGDRFVLEQLGIGSLSPSGSTTLDNALNPDDDKVYIGVYENMLIVTGWDFPDQFYHKGLGKLEEKLMAAYPNAEILTFSLHSVVNHWGYALLRGGKKVRVKSGSADYDVAIDIGEPLDEEAPLLSRSFIDERGDRVFRLHEGGPPLSEDQVGEQFVFDITERFIGQRMDRADDAFFSTVMREYTLERGPAAIDLEQEALKDRKVKIYLLIGFVIIVISYLILQFFLSS